MDELLTVKEVAAIIRHAKIGNIKAVKIGGSWRFTRTAINELISRVDTGYSTCITKRVPTGGKRGRPANRSNL